MRDITNDLLAAYLFGGFVVALAWAAVLGEILLGHNRTIVRGGVLLLAVAGLANPVGAVACWDLVRVSRQAEGAADRLPSWTSIASVAWVAICVAALPIVLGGVA